MNINIGMPEILVVFALVMYSQNFWFAVIAFSLGLLARIVTYLMDYGTKMQSAEQARQDIKGVSDLVKDMFQNEKTV